MNSKYLSFTGVEWTGCEFGDPLVRVTFEK